MKKLVLNAVALVVSVYSFAGGNGVNGHDEPVQGGFFLSGHIGFYGSDYLLNKDIAKSIDNNFKVNMIGVGLEIGNMFQLTDFSSGGERGLGIRAIWLGASIFGGSNDIYDKGGLSLHILSPGIYYTQAFGNNAIDVYANIVPTIAATAMVDKNGDDIGDPQAGAGVPFKLGASFRRGILCTGIEYNFGQMEFTGEDSDFTYKVNSNHLRILVGMKF